MRFHFACTSIFLALFTLGTTAKTGNEPVRKSVNLSCNLPAPAYLNTERTSSSTATLDWETVTGATSYRLIVYNLATLELHSNTVEYGTNKSLNGLESGNEYRCTVAAICSGGTASDFVIAEDILD